MKQQEYLDSIHAEILTVMDEVHKICVEHGLKYYLIGGTLLGAIRHGGFIPWDDDLDIVMPREDFDKFKELTKKQTSQFKLIYGKAFKHYPLYFMKYENTETTFFEGMMWEKTKKPGIFVDIFPLEHTMGNMRVLNLQKRAICRLTDIITKKASIEGIYMTIPERLLYPLLPMALLKYTREKIARLNYKKDSTHYANFGSQYSIAKQHYPKEVFGEGQLIRFGDREYYAPEDPYFVLNNIFGSNYMQVPPIVKRRTHYPKLVRFSNQQIVEFEEPQHRVSVNDQ